MSTPRFAIEARVSCWAGFLVHRSLLRDGDRRGQPRTVAAGRPSRCAAALGRSLNRISEARERWREALAILTDLDPQKADELCALLDGDEATLLKQGGKP